MPRRLRFASTRDRKLALLVALALALELGCTARTATILRIEAPSADQDADVFIDGNYVGQIGALNNPRIGAIQLAPGVHRVEVRKPGRFPVQRTVRVERRPPAEVVVEAELLEDPL